MAYELPTDIEYSPTAFEVAADHVRQLEDLVRYWSRMRQSLKREIEHAKTAS
jgi:hypothetical protein